MKILNTLAYITILTTLTLMLYVIHFFILSGIVYNKPLTFLNYDPQIIPLEKTEYKRGETVITKPLSFCKNRHIEEISTLWSYKNGVLHTGELQIFPNQSELPVGCYYDLQIEIGVVPESALVGALAVFQGVGTYKLNEFNTVKYDYKTEGFQIVE